MVDAIFNGLLVGSSGYALSLVAPAKHPFLFTACAVGLYHGVFGLYANIIEGRSNSQKSLDPPSAEDSFMRKAQHITQCCVDIMTVPLINIDLYMLSEQSSSLALGHALFVVPLVFDLTFKIFDNEDGEDSATETLKELSILGNVVSLVFLSVNENNLIYGLMAMSALLAQFGSNVMENMLRGSGANIALMGYSLLLSLIPEAIAKS
ncbi:uncharacterized protein LOC133337530 [Musca vetustissima]|uniref:uncharacterized protein LOC133337530 n=1 Tax=Musca vetustissima TaxID=27455 RepID=UPI002AB6E6B8|nr:uncharacterized protein LOC133337530 [Musca vetustissima]